MGNTCCSSRERDESTKVALSSWLGSDIRETPETRVLPAEDGRGFSTVAARGFQKGEILFQEPALMLVYPDRDPPWLAAMRADLKKVSDACAWQYCMAVRCLSAEELPQSAPADLQPLGPGERAKIRDLCGESAAEDLEPSELACVAARHLLQGGQDDAAALRRLAARLDDLAARISRNGFQVMDMKARPPTSADALFHRVSFLNHCCCGMNTATWTWSGGDGLMTVRTTRGVDAGEELTISYISKPWSDLSKQARRRYLKQNYNFDCLCKACAQPAQPAQPAPAAKQPEEVDPSGGKPAAPQDSVAKLKLAGLLRRWMEEETQEVVSSDEGSPGPGRGPKQQQQQHQQQPPKKSDAAAARAEEEKPPGPSPLFPPPQSAEPGAAKPSSAAAAAAATPPLTDAERLERVLKRCGDEGVAVTREEAASALRAETGHIGKTMIRLRRLRR